MAAIPHDASSFRQWVVSHTRCGSQLNGVQKLYIAKVASATKEHLSTSVEDLLAANTYSPALLWYASDGWSFRGVRYQQYSNAESSLSGSYCLAPDKQEYLLQRAFVRVMTGARISPPCWPTSMPLDFRDGNSAQNSVSACNEFVPTLQEMGHRGFSISVHCFDGHLRSLVGKMLDARNQAYHDHNIACMISSLDRKLHYLKDWFLLVPCLSHICHLATKHSVETFIDAAMYEDMWCVVASVRNVSFKLNNVARGICDTKCRISLDDIALHDRTEYWELLLGDSHSELRQSCISLDPFIDDQGCYITP